MKKQILILSITAFTVKLYVTFMLIVLNLLDEFEGLGAPFEWVVNQFRKAYNHLNYIYMKYDIKLYSRKVHEADVERTKAYRSLRDMIRYKLTYPGSEAIGAAAGVLLDVIKLYGEATKMKLNERTAVIVNLIEDFEDKYPEQVEAAGVGDLLGELKAAQATFNEAFMERIAIDSQTALKAMADARKLMDEAYRDLVSAVNIAAKHDEEGALSDFIDRMNYVIRKNFIHTGQSGNTSSGSADSGEDSEVVVPEKSAKFTFVNGNSVSLKFAVGSPIEAPENTEGYKWKPAVPEFMPSTNKFFKEVAIDPEKATAFFHFADHHEEEIREIVGAILHAPANTEGYVWDPEVPETMPAEDTTYFEVPAVQLPPKFKVTYVKGQYTWMTQEYAAGDRIVPPAEPEAFRWVDVPEFMPDHDITIYAQYVG